MAEKKRCVIQIKNNDDLCCARSMVTMREKADEGNQFDNLRGFLPIQETLAKILHEEAGVLEGPCGYAELQQFQTFLGPQGTSLSSWIHPGVSPFFLRPRL